MALVSGLIAGVAKVPAALVAAAAVTLSAYGVSFEWDVMGASHWFVWSLAVLCIVIGHVYAMVGRGPT